MGIWGVLGYSLGFARGSGFVGADDEQGEEDGEEATAGREKIVRREEKGKKKE